MRSLVAALILCFCSQANAAEHCIASVYGTKDKDQNGTRTASGIPLNDSLPSIAHKTLPLKSRVWVVNKRTGQGHTFLVTDRGPYIAGRCIDLSHAAAILLGCNGLCPVSVD